MSSQTIPIELPGQVGFLATATICMVLPTALVVLRILARRKTSLSLNASDYCIIAALVCPPPRAFRLLVIVVVEDVTDNPIN